MQSAFVIICVFAAIFIVARHVRHQWRKGLYFTSNRKNTLGTK